MAAVCKCMLMWSPAIPQNVSCIAKKDGPSSFSLTCTWDHDQHNLKTTYTLRMKQYVNKHSTTHTEQVYSRFLIKLLLGCSCRGSRVELCQSEKKSCTITDGKGPLISSPIHINVTATNDAGKACSENVIYHGVWLIGECMKTFSNFCVKEVYEGFVIFLQIYCWAVPKRAPLSSCHWFFILWVKLPEELFPMKLKVCVIVRLLLYRRLNVKHDECRCFQAGLLHATVKQLRSYHALAEQARSTSV